MKDFFSLRRMGLLARKDFFQFWRRAVIGAAAASGVLLIVSMFEILFESHDTLVYAHVFSTITVVWGIIAASQAFQELHDKTRNDDYLLLPASTMEKASVRIIEILVVLPLFILMFLTLSSLIIATIKVLFFDSDFRPFNPFSDETRLQLWPLLGHLAIVQSVFLVGAAWFKKAHLVKTVLAVSLFSIVLWIFIGISIFITFNSYIENIVYSKVQFVFENILNGKTQFGFYQDAAVIGKILYYGLLAPFCWTIVWLRIKESQSSDGI